MPIGKYISAQPRTGQRSIADNSTLYDRTWQNIIGIHKACKSLTTIYINDLQHRSDHIILKHDHAEQYTIEHDFAE